MAGASCLRSQASRRSALIRATLGLGLHVSVGLVLAVSPLRCLVEALAMVALGAWLLRRTRELAVVVTAGGSLIRVAAYAASPDPTSGRLSIGVCLAGCSAFVLLLWPHARRTRALRWALGTSLAACSLLGTFLIGEILARGRLPDVYFVAPLPDSEADTVYASHPDLGHCFSPRFRGRFLHPEFRGEILATNELGFRCPDWGAQNSEPQRPRPFGIRESPAARRLLLFGDSISVGLGVDWSESLPGLLEEGLSSPEERWSVFNASVPGYSVAHHVLLFPDLSKEVQPDLVIAVLYDGNDLLEARALAHKRGETRLPEEPQGEVESLLARRDERWRPTLFERAYWFRASRLYPWVDTAITSRLGIASPIHSINDFLLRSMRREPDPQVLGARRTWSAAMAELARLCRETETPFLVVRIPTKLQAEPSSAQRVLRDCGADPTQFDRREPGHSLLVALAVDGRATLDLMPSLESPLASNPAYFHEGHLSRTGLVLAAREIGAAVRQHGWAGERGPR